MKETKFAESTPKKEFIWPTPAEAESNKFNWIERPVARRSLGFKHLHFHACDRTLFACKKWLFAQITRINNVNRLCSLQSWTNFCYDCEWHSEDTKGTRSAYSGKLKRAWWDIIDYFLFPVKWKLLEIGHHRNWNVSVFRVRLPSARSVKS